jgi:hypothetical protein
VPLAYGELAQGLRDAAAGPTGPLRGIVDSFAPQKLAPECR